jgi:YD repeat-containing protein
VVQQSYDTIGRLCAIAGQISGCSSMTNPYASGFGYNTAFEVTGFNYGNGVVAALGYSADRLQLTSLAYTKSLQTLYSLNYYYKQDPTNCPGGTTGNNGQIQCIHDNVNNGRSATYTYDPLLRLSTAVTTGSTGYPQWGLSWTYDRYGNRTAQTVTAGEYIRSNAENVLGFADYRLLAPGITARTSSSNAETSGRRCPARRRP